MTAPETIAVAAAVLSIILAGAAVVFLVSVSASLRKASEQASSNAEALSRLSESLARHQAAMEEQRKGTSSELKLLHQAVEAALASSDRRLTAGLDETRKAIVGVTGKLSALDQAGKDLKEAVIRLSELRRLLAAPGARGSFGERLMEHWIREVLPPRYILTQHEIPGAGRVDLAVKVGERIIPIDSKFPTDVLQKVSQAEGEKELLNARKELQGNLRKRIDEVAKYVVPGKGTYPFALMFVPSEGAFLEVVRDPETTRYAIDRRVIPVGPSTFLAYLEVIHEGLRGFEVEETTRRILEELDNLRSLAEAAEAGLTLHEKHIRNASNTLADTRKALGKLSAALDSLRQLDAPGDQEARSAQQ